MGMPAKQPAVIQIFTKKHETLSGGNSCGGERGMSKNGHVIYTVQ
jgi:hypothetical protein